MADDDGVNAELPYVDEAELGEFGDEAWAAYQYVVPGLLFECGDFVFEGLSGQSRIVPGDTLDRAREENFRDVLDCVGKVVHVFIAGGLFDDCGPEGFHELVRCAAV